MNPDKYQQAWKAEASQVQVTFDADVLSKEVHRSREAFRSMIHRRHVGVAVAAFSMIPIWLVMGILLLLPWTWYLTVPVLLWIAGFMLVTLRSYSRRPTSLGEPLLLCAKESLAQVELQVWLMRSSFWWNLLPATISLMAYHVHNAWGTTHSWWGFCLATGGFGVFLFLVYRWAYRTMQLSVRKELEPRRSELQNLIVNLEGDGNVEDTNLMMHIVSTLAETDRRADLSSNRASGAENWNRIIPSWREFALIAVPTLAVAYVGFRSPLAFIGNGFVQSVLAGFMAFIVAFISLCFVSHWRHKGQPLPKAGEVSLNAAALVTIVLILVMAILVFAASFLHARTLRSQRSAAPNNVGAPADDR